MTDNGSDQQEKKIFVDEDWKTRVQAEKEAAKQSENESVENGKSTQQEASPQQDMPLPPATLGFLATSLATQAMISLGLAPDPGSEKAEARPEEARHLIDTLAMLQEKTEGNRTPDETAIFDNFLHQLRMAFVTVTNKTDA